MHSRRPSSVLLAAIATLVIAGSAFAAKPAMRTFDLTLTDEVLVSCGAFDVLENSVTTVRRTIFFDAAGQRVRIQLYSRFTGTFSNSVTGAFVTDTPDPQLAVIDLRDGSLAVYGLVFHVRMPDGGMIIVDAGNVTISPDGELTIHGPHSVLENGYGALCTALNR